MGASVPEGFDPSRDKTKDIPTSIEVLDALSGLGGKSTAAGVCEALRATGVPVSHAQLGIQRAVDRGDIIIEDDWSLRIGDVNFDYVGGSIGRDRWGRRVRGALMSIPICREEYLVEHAWRETSRGWVKRGGMGKPLSRDAAFQIEAILQELDSDSDGSPQGGDGEAGSVHDSAGAQHIAPDAFPQPQAGE